MVEPVNSPGRVAPGGVAPEVRAQVRAACGPQAAAALTFLAAGEECRVYTADGLAFRFPNHGDCAVEVALLQELAPRLPARVPLPRGDHTAFMIYDLVPGIPGDETTPSARLAADLGRFLSALHSFPVDTALALGARRRDDHWTPRRYRDRVRAQAGDRALPPRAAAFLAPDAPVPADAPTPGRLIHGDLEAEHVFVDEHTGGLAGVIDWDDASIADPARDFGGLWAWGGTDFLERVLDTYGLPLDTGARERITFLGRAFALSDWLESVDDGPPKQDFTRRQLERVFCDERDPR